MNNSSNLKTVIMAGGRGTRISELAADLPKPMIKIAGKPVLEYIIEELRRQGLKDITITVGHKAEKIIDYFGDGNKISACTGKPFGVSIDYHVEEKPMGNAGALFNIKERLGDDFLLLNADSIFRIDLKAMLEFHKFKGGLVTIHTHASKHPEDCGLIITNEDCKVTSWLNKEDPRPAKFKNCVNSGVHIVSSKILETRPKTEKVDLDRQVFKPLVDAGEIYSYNTDEYIEDMGTPERLKIVEDYVSANLL